MNCNKNCSSICECDCCKPDKVFTPNQTWECKHYLHSEKDHPPGGKCKECKEYHDEKACGQVTKEKEEYHNKLVQEDREILEYSCKDLLATQKKEFIEEMKELTEDDIRFAQKNRVPCQTKAHQRCIVMLNSLK